MPLTEAIKTVGPWQAALAVGDGPAFATTCRTQSSKTEDFATAAAWRVLAQHPKETVAAYLAGASGGRIYL